MQYTYKTSIHNLANKTLMNTYKHIHIYQLLYITYINYYKYIYYIYIHIHIFLDMFGNTMKLHPEKLKKLRDSHRLKNMYLYQ